MPAEAKTAQYFSHSFALKFFAAVLVFWLLSMAVLMRNSALDETATGTMLVVFDPATANSEAFQKIANAGGTVIRQTGFDFIWLVNSEVANFSGALKQQGAIGAYRDLPLNPTLAGCFALADAKAFNTL